MPELPEVETIRRGLSKSILNKTIEGAVVRRTDLRRPITTSFAGQMLGKVITTNSTNPGMKSRPESKALAAWIARYRFVIWVALWGTSFLSSTTRYIRVTGKVLCLPSFPLITSLSSLDGFVPLPAKPVAF